MSAEKQDDYKLLDEAERAITLKRLQLGIAGTKTPLSPQEFTELLSGKGILYRHGVLSRRLGNSFETAGTMLEAFVKSVGDVANFGYWSNAVERREIPHPPFESCGAVAVGPPESAIQVDTPNIVVHVDFMTGKVINPQNPVPLEHFPISA